MASNETFAFEPRAPVKPGTIASLHMHPTVSGEPMTSVESMTLVADKGIVGNVRYFGILDRRGNANKNHVSLFEREQIAEHAASVGLDTIAPGLTLSNVETRGVDLLDLVGFDVRVGATVVLRFYKARVPCTRMDEIAYGLFRLMRYKQGVLAEVIVGDEIKVGDTLCLVEEDAAT
jgi:MOSC domain-containing protein YiiM